MDRYNKIIEYYKENIVEGFLESHHIQPKCMGGTDDKNNLVLLPSKAHFIVHYLLHKAYPKNRKLAHAFAMMGVNNGKTKRKQTGRLYEESKKARVSALKGVPRPEWVKEKLRKPKTNKENYKNPKSKSHKNAISVALRGKKKSKEHIKNSIDARKDGWNKQKKITQKRIQKYRTLFENFNGSRKEFYKLHPELSEATLKRYLKFM